MVDDSLEELKKMALRMTRIDEGEDSHSWRVEKIHTAGTVGLMW